MEMEIDFKPEKDKGVVFSATRQRLQNELDELLAAQKAYEDEQKRIAEQVAENTRIAAEKAEQLRREESARIEKEKAEKLRLQELSRIEEEQRLNPEQQETTSQETLLVDQSQQETDPNTFALAFQENEVEASQDEFLDLFDLQTDAGPSFLEPLPLPETQQAIVVPDLQKIIKTTVVDVLNKVSDSKKQNRISISSFQKIEWKQYID